MECRAYGICLDSQSRGYLGKDRKVSSAAGGNLSRMHKTQETAKESRLNFMYSHLRNRTLAFTKTCGSVTCARNWRFVLNAQTGKTALHTTRSRSACCAASSWRERFGYSPLVAESFTDPEAYAGTCYKASGWEAVGMSQGNSRHRPDFYVPNQRPKRLWLKDLCPKARQRLCALSLTQADAPAAVAIQNGVLPLNPLQVLSLFELLRHAPDPRAKNTQFRIGAVLTLVAMAILAGARDIAQIARFATRLHPKQRAALGLPRKVGTRCFYRVPGYNVFYQVLIRLDADQFARRLSEWLQAQSGMLPSALALDGKMIRDCIGTVTLAEHEDGSPVALAIMDQKEGTRRCEQSAAASLLESLPALDGKVVTADALHCQKLTARTIVEKGGDYLLQIKANQPALLRQAQAAGAVSSPLLSTPTPDTVGSKSVA